MPGFIDFHEGLQAQLKEAGVRVSKLNKELTELRAAYTRFHDATREQEAAEDRFRVLVGIIHKKDSKTPFDIEPGVAIKSAADERENTPLWKVIREFVRLVSEIRIVELESALRPYGYKVSRQAIESAIDTHKDIFRSTRKGRERFVALK